MSNSPLSIKTVTVRYAFDCGTTISNSTCGYRGRCSRTQTFCLDLLVLTRSGDRVKMCVRARVERSSILLHTPRSHGIHERIAGYREDEHDKSENTHRQAIAEQVRNGYGGQKQARHDLSLILSPNREYRPEPLHCTCVSS